ncbi:DUF5753 domain-containing protein [Nonomuraea sp. C10]|uniref:DUF5753 domain-containing protein n=1 Tax=Nonomuraea sp. C10 TaxID=2600577 RepID=UPI0011CED27A|nr:DUF5753 domain-containing protein [Nonomuraea sp. C10]TXK34826.1 hypothetical protein FR742_36580 [Nonomuraea sp. C10]
MEDRLRTPGELPRREAAEAARVRSARWMAVFSPAMIPPLLQTADYARLAIGPDTDDTGDTAGAVAARVDAQAVLLEEGRRFAFVLTEGAVRTRPGSPSLMPAQLDRLVEVSALPHVRLGVVPWKTEAAAFPLHGFTIYDGTVSVVETLTGDLTLTGSSEIAAHEEAFEAFAAAAVYGDELRDLLADIATDYRTLIDRLKAR